MEILGCPGTIM